MSSNRSALTLNLNHQARIADADHIAGLQRPPRGEPLVIQIRAVCALQIKQPEGITIKDDAGVLTGELGIGNWDGVV